MYQLDLRQAADKLRADMDARDRADRARVEQLRKDNPHLDVDEMARRGKEYRNWKQEQANWLAHQQMQLDMINGMYDQ